METVVTLKTSDYEREISEAEADLLRAGAALWRAVIREADLPAEDTRLVLGAIRASLDAARRLRFAGSGPEDDPHRLAALAAEAAACQECALRRWYVGRGFRLAAVRLKRTCPAETLLLTR